MVTIATGTTPTPLEATGITNLTDYKPQIAAAPDGSYAIVYSGTDSGAYHSIYVQRFNADGTALGAQTKLESGTYTGTDENTPQLTYGPDGSFVVVFEGYDPQGSTAIYVQKFNADGSLSGSQTSLEANFMSTGNGEDLSPQVAFQTDGSYVVTYSGQDTSLTSSIYVQKFNADGTLGASQTELQATGITGRYDSSPQIETSPTGNGYAVVYQGYDGGDYSVYVQRFNQDGTLAGSQVKLESDWTTTGQDASPQIKYQADGSFAVTWTDNYGAGTGSILLQKFNADGTLSGSQIRIDSMDYAGGIDNYPQLVALPDGGYVVTFQGPETAAGSDSSIYVQKVNANGTLAQQVKLEGGIDTAPDYVPQIAVQADGTFAVAFQGRDTALLNEDSIYVQEFNLDGTLLGSKVKVEPLGQEVGTDDSVQIVALAGGGYALTFHGYDSGVGDQSVYGMVLKSDSATFAACFTRGTMIQTSNGEKNIEDLNIGDRIVTKDHGLQTIRWIGSSYHLAQRKFAPILIKKGALGNKRDLLVSPQHRMLLSGLYPELMFGVPEVLATAQSLVNDQTIIRIEGGVVEYYHILFDHHEIIFAEGAPSESFHPGKESLSALDQKTRDEIFEIFPEFIHWNFGGFGASARFETTHGEGALLGSFYFGH